MTVKGEGDEVKKKNQQTNENEKYFEKEREKAGARRETKSKFISNDFFFMVVNVKMIEFINETIQNNNCNLIWRVFMRRYRK